MVYWLVSNGRSLLDLKKKAQKISLEAFSTVCRFFGSVCECACEQEFLCASLCTCQISALHDLVALSY